MQSTDPQSRDRGFSSSRTGDSDRSEPLLAFFIPDLSVGGAEQVTVSIVNGLAARGYEIDLLLSRFEGELQPRLSDDVNVVTLPPAKTSVFGVAAHLPALVSYLRRENPTVLVPHLEHPSVVCLAAGRIPGVDTPIIPTQHSAFGVSSELTPKDRVVRALVPRLYPTANRIIAVSEGVADGLSERTPVSRDRISVIHNPVEIESVRERAREPVDHEWIEDDVEVVLFVGRLARQKDLETWLRAFRIVHDRNSDLRGVIVGRGSRREELLTLARELGIEDAVSMPGFVENPYRYMKRASVFVLSSEYEGLPTVLIEALACGCPVVSTDCPNGPREILMDGSLGPLVPVGDEDELANAVVSTLADPTPSSKLRERADEFRPRAVFDQYERFIREYVISE